MWWLIIRESSQSVYDSDKIVSWFAQNLDVNDVMPFFYKAGWNIVKPAMCKYRRVVVRRRWGTGKIGTLNLPPHFRYMILIWYIYIYFLFLYILYIHLYIQHSQLLHQTILDVFFPSSWSKGGIPIVMRLFTTFPAGLGKPQMVVNYESGNPTTKMAYKNSD